MKRPELRVGLDFDLRESLAHITRARTTDVSPGGGKTARVSPGRATTMSGKDSGAGSSGEMHTASPRTVSGDQIGLAKRVAIVRRF
ncbi:MAG: hypothetical protein OXL34_16730 [Gemmatimonadota bacterium]|nr:hypothetical protein [Gemmatimonadota bacterium]